MNRDELELAGRNEAQISKAKHIEICKPNYPIPTYWDWELSRKRSVGIIMGLIPHPLGRMFLWIPRCLRRGSSFKGFYEIFPDRYRVFPAQC
jgi:hypothetical protein